jgi:PAS domain S-box-containing protein
VAAVILSSESPTGETLMLEFLAHLFDTADFPPRWQCGNWSEAHGWLHVLSDLGVWSAYFAIPCILVTLVLRRRDVPFPAIFWLFGAFILACGTTHLMEAIIFWHPLYRLAGLIKLATALISWATVAALVPVVPKVLAMRSPEELEHEIAAREEAEKALHQANAVLERQVVALQASEERFRLLVDGVKDHAIFMLDPIGRVATWNPGAERITQFHADEILGQPFRRLYTDEDARTGKPDAHLRVAATEGRYEAEAWRARKDGSRFWANVVLTALRDAHGELRGFTKVTRDITERKQAEENARRLVEEAAARRAAEELAAADKKNRELLKLIHQIARIGHWEWNAATDENRWSPEIEALYGLPPGGFEGGYQGWARLLHPDDLPGAEADVRRALETGAYFTEFRVIWPDGSVHWLETRANVLKDENGKPERIIGVNMDITERKRQEEALRANEERWRTMAEALPNLVWTDLPNGECDWLSSQWGKYTGIPEQELLGLRWLETVIHPDDRMRTLACWQAACADQGDYDLEYRIRRHDGEYHWFKTRGVAIRDAEGKIVYWFGTCTDIEDVKRLEAALREADQRKDAFLATLAHELRNPLAPIRNGLQILRLSGDRTVREQAREMMERQLAQLVRLVDDLLDMSRVSRNRLELRKARIPLASVIDNAVETARPLIDANGHTLTVTLPAERIEFDADLTRLAQVFWNLLNNSAKYTDPGGRIELVAEREGSDVVVTVRDSGIGIPGDAMPRLFTLFSQIDQSLERAHGGLGIGLALVKGLVEMHGGNIEARSAGSGQGTEFVVRLPIAIETSPAEQPANLDGKPVIRRRVLVVDDMRDCAASLTMMLALAGHDTRTAHDGLEAVELAEAFRPEVVLLDIGLPKLNGYDACRRIREQPWGKDMRIIAVTGWGQPEDRERSRAAGFDRHLVKPVDIAKLQSLLAEFAGARGGDRQGA